MTLHCLSAAPDSDSFSQCLRVAGPDDVVLLMGDACYALLPGSDAERALSRCRAKLRVLAVDATVRGLPSGPVAATDSDEFVALSEAHQQQVAWY